MSAEQLFLREGAFYFGQRLLYRNQDVGTKSASGLVLTSAGDEFYVKLGSVTDVEVKPKAPRTKKGSPDAVDEPAKASLDELLGE
jgi:hypothetical protein